MKYKAVRGMDDILPEDAQIWQWLEKTARAELEFYGYKEIRTPILEETGIFVRGIGETTDIVTKEMYTFNDKRERSLALRPEGTAPIVRAYIEHALYNVSPECRLYYIGPMFRSERPQKGRSRQFHQIGVEVLGTNSPYADAEIIRQVNSLLKLFGLQNFTIKVNSLGCKTDKAAFAESFKKYLSDKKARICDTCRDRMKKNVLRVLDCKNESCAEIARQAPDIADNLCGTCKDHIAKVKNALKGVKLEEAKNLVRGLDYYTGTVFEITHPSLGAQDAIGAGGRYDNLVKDLGGPDTGAVGYALGMERIIIALKKEIPGSDCAKVVYIATLGDAAKIRGIQIAEKLRKSESFADIIVLTDVKEASLKSQMRTADKNNARAVIILGENELREGRLTIRNMVKKTEESVEENKLFEILKNALEG